MAPSISVVIPVRNGGRSFRHLARHLARLRGDLHREEIEELQVLVIDSGSDDGTPECAEAAGFDVERIPPERFGHGRTRNLGVRLARGEIVCFLTDDVLPVTPDWPLRFAKVLRDPTVAGVYGRQVPRDATTMEMYFVALNYPEEPLRFEPRPDGHSPRPGRVVFSNAFSAVRRKVALEVPIPEEADYSEDQIWARRALAAGYAIAYEPSAEALHAHVYRLRSVFRRSFFVGRALRSAGIDGGAGFGESVRFLAGEIGYFVRQGHIHRLPQLLPYEFLRWAGFQAGRLYGPGRGRSTVGWSAGNRGDTVGSDPSRTPNVVEFTYGRSRKDRSTIRIEGVDPNDHISRVIRGNETFYELELLEYLPAIFSREERSVVIDVGANIGNHAVFFARYIASHVIAIEPNPAVLPVLERNLRNNADDESWSIVAVALGSGEGVGVMELPAGAERNIGMARVRQAPASESPGDPVTVTTLDRVVDDFYDSGQVRAPLRLIKIDAEGMETDVLEGATRTIKRFAPDIVVEAKDDSEKAQLDALLEPLGYVAVSRHCATPTYHYVKNPSRRRRLAARISGFYRSLQVKVRWAYDTLRGK